MSATFVITEATMREALEAQLMFSGLPPATLAAVIDALVADAVFVNATKIVAERIAFHASRIVVTPSGTIVPAS